MATPTFNKYKSTTIFGNLSVRDLTNSSGTTVVEVASTDLSGNFLSQGNSTFTKKVVCNALLADINANNILTTKQYVDSAVSAGGGSILGLNNTFTGTNLFNNNVDVSGNFNIINATEINNSFSIKDTNNVVKISISPIGINQTDPTGENNYNGVSYHQNTLTQQDIPLPSGKTNTFINSNFIEGIDVSGNSTFNTLTINKSFNLLPAGMVIQYTGSTAPTGWLLCNGNAYNASTNPIYQALFNVIGIQFGGNNNTDFKSPDYRGSFLRCNGEKQAHGTTYASSSLNTSQAHANQSHVHNANHGHGSSSHMFKVTGLNQNGVGFDVIHSFPTNRPFTSTGMSIGGNNFDTGGQTSGSTNANETRPFNYSINYLIKY